MILFLGCSLTWGQGLQIEKWISEGKSADFCNKHAVPMYHAEHLTYEDDLFRKSKAYPNLVAKELNVSHSTKWGNGGTNDEILFIIENLEKLIHPYVIQLIVIQFTDLVRDDLFSYINKKEFGDLTDLVLKNQIAKIDNILSHCQGLNQNIPWLGLSWHKEHSDFLKEKYPKNFVRLYHDDKEFDNIHSLNSYGKVKQRFELCDIYKGVEDGHPSSIWHNLIADSIIKKINKENIKFKRYSNLSGIIK